MGIDPGDKFSNGKIANYSRELYFVPFASKNFKIKNLNYIKFKTNIHG